MRNPNEIINKDRAFPIKSINIMRYPMDFKDSRQTNKGDRKIVVALADYR